MTKTLAKANFEAVAAACDAMTAAGETVSVRKVTLKIGGGSPNDIGPLIKKWKNQKPVVEARKSIVIDPRINDLIAEQILRDVADARRAAESERDESIDDYELIAERGRELEEQAEVDRARISELEQKIQHAQGVIDELRADAEKVRIETASAIATAKHEASEVAKKARSEADSEREKNDSLARQLGAMQTLSDSLSSKADELATRLVETNDALEKERVARIEAEKSLAAAEATIKAETARLADLEKFSAAAQQRALDAENALAVERIARAAAETSAARAEAQADERSKAVLSLEARLKSISESK